MTSTKPIVLLKNFCLLATVESIVTFCYLIYIPKDTKNAWLLGFSRSRAILIFGFALVTLLLFWISVSFIRKTHFSEKITFISTNLLNTRYLVWGLLAFSVLVIVGGCFVLWQWNFAPTDQQIRAYLQRLTPIATFVTLIFAQTLVILWLSSFSQNIRDRWIFFLILLGGYILFLWLLVAEFQIANRFFSGYYIAERFGLGLQNPWVLLQTAFYCQLPYLLRRQLQIEHNFRWMPAVFLIVMGYFYVKACMAHAIEVNTDLSRGDQGAYTEFIQQVYNSKFTFTGARNQTPGYPYFQALFCGSKSNDQTVFLCGKQANIILSVILLLILLWIFRRFLSSSQAIILTLIAAYYVFIFKAGYLKAEVAYYFASFVCFLLMSRMLIHPSIKLGGVTGIALGLTHLIKASVLPGMAVFILIFLSKEIWSAIREEKSRYLSHSKTSLSGLMLTLLCFIAVIFPYIRESKQIYGQYFYNVNTTFYIWYDSFADAIQANKELRFDLGTIDLPEDQRPSLKKYLREHSTRQILDRFCDGLQKQVMHFWDQYGVFNYLLFFLVVTGLFFIANFERGKTLLRQYFPLFCFVVLYAMGYFVLFAWYHPIAGGPRFMTGLFLPLIFSSFMLIKALSDNKIIRFFRYRIKLSKSLEGINALTIAMIISDAYIIITKIMPQGYFGS